MVGFESHKNAFGSIKGISAPLRCIRNDDEEGQAAASANRTDTPHNGKGASEY